MIETRLFGLNVLPLSDSEVLDRIISGKIVSGWFVTLNLEMVARMDDDDYANLISSADYYVMDGMPIVWLASKKSQLPLKRCNGTDLAHSILNSDTDSIKIGIIGGNNNLIRIEEKFLRNVIYNNEENYIENETYLNSIINNEDFRRSNIILISLGVPKQDALAHRLREKYPNKIYIGIGGALDLISGQKPRAPILMQKLGLEWLHRLITEPRRLWRRYVTVYPKALPAIMKELSKTN